jgi:hypothetical protein
MIPVNDVPSPGLVEEKSSSSNGDAPGGRHGTS